MHALAGMMPLEIGELLDLKPFQGKQIFQWIHQKQVFDFDAMSNLSKPLRARLAESCTASQVRLLESRESESTGTKKVLLELADGETVEAVLIRGGDRVTLCVSSQVGCPLKCSFCATGLAGWQRDLNAGEIAEQALYLLRGEPMEGRTPNIVYMGMGEPLRNYDAVMDSIRLLMVPEGLGIGARKITISTAGEVDAIERFAQEEWQVRLSVSLHSAEDALRSKLVPLNRRYPLARLHEALARYQRRTARQFTFEWTLLDGVNDRDRDADALVEYMRGLKASVNLIPWNPVAGIPYKATPRQRCEEFRDRLLAREVTATLRREKGQDIDAACGQLRRTHGQ